MAWLTTATSDNQVRQSTKVLTETMLDFAGGGSYDVYTRTRTITTDHYIGMTQTAADSAAATFGAGTNVVDAHSERKSDAGDYDVVVVTDVRTAWVYVPPA